jgi:hypothetical protein
MNTYLYNILWSINSGYIYYAIILGILTWGFVTAVVIYEVGDIRYLDIWDDIIGPIALGLLGAGMVGILWPICLAVILLLGINLLFVWTILNIIIPTYKFIKSIPFLDFRKGEDIPA